jgi:hypothetical protein
MRRVPKDRLNDGYGKRSMAAIGARFKHAFIACQCAPREVTMQTQLRLDGNALAPLRGQAQVCVTQGTLWLTVEGQLDDVVLDRGQCVTLPAGARALLQAVKAPARACITRRDGWRERLQRAWLALLHPRSAAQESSR